MKDRINYLLERFKADQLTELEKQELLGLTEKEPVKVKEEIETELYAITETIDEPVNRNGKWEGVLNQILQVDKPIYPKQSKLIPMLKWAVAAVLLLGISALWYFNNSSPTIVDKQALRHDALPGKDKAVLTLADGNKISLTDIRNGEIAKQAGIAITKTADGQLVYHITDVPQQGEAIKVNTITTPRGGKWQVHLADGSTVWLNSASSLTYPLSFKQDKERKVTLSGEAYFEVAKDKTRPFIVHTDHQDVEVLGTHFNICSYADEESVKTTLLEGSVKVSMHEKTGKAEILKPGEQSIVSATGISVVKANVEEAVAWKDGYFMFDNERQESIMRKISRWYDIDIEYADPSVEDIMYYGTMSRFDNVSKVLRKLEQTGAVQFEIKDNKIIVHKKK